MSLLTDDIVTGVEVVSSTTGVVRRTEKNLKNLKKGGTLKMITPVKGKVYKTQIWYSIYFRDGD